MTRLLLHLLPIVVLISAMVPAFACEPARVLQPQGGAPIADARPTLTWEALPGVERYRVQIEARVPEGRVLMAIDTVVTATTFTPPQPLTDSRAAVKVLVTSECTGTGLDALREQPAWFYIDTSPNCAPLTEPRFDSARSTLQWRSGGPALRYEVLVYATSNGLLQHRGETLVTRATLPRAVGPAVVAIRPFCATGYGKTLFVPIAGALP